MKIAIVGLGGSYADYISARIASQDFDEVWGINCIGAILHVDRTFMMDPVSRFIDTENAGSQTGVAREFLAKNAAPIYSCIEHKDYPSIELYPLEKVVKDTGICYFNNTVAYAIAYAVWKKVKKICLYGIDFTYKNVNMAESGRACVEFWCATAIAKGIKIEVAHRSGLLDTNVPDNEKLYGYHRLDDPLIQTVQEGNLLITKQSQFDPPEPVDGALGESEPIIFGRHDHV
jgi:hypothetical protein|tara:strand:- start:86 stop:778 length:693 start_codon:yes stop_codon:yes gene_type:complete